MISLGLWGVNFTERRILNLKLIVVGCIALKECILLWRHPQFFFWWAWDLMTYNVTDIHLKIQLSIWACWGRGGSKSLISVFLQLLALCLAYSKCSIVVYEKQWYDMIISELQDMTNMNGQTEEQMTVPYGINRGSTCEAGLRMAEGRGYIWERKQSTPLKRDNIGARETAPWVGLLPCM